jgi:hypothetical protein
MGRGSENQSSKSLKTLKPSQKLNETQSLTNCLPIDQIPSIKASQQDNIHPQTTLLLPMRVSRSTERSATALNVLPIMQKQQIPNPFEVLFAFEFPDNKELELADRYHLL